MIDDIYQVLKTITNKELRGNVTPAEFNLIAIQVQDEIFRGYFEDENRDKNKENRGLTNKNYAHLPFVQRQRIDQFSSSATLAYSAPNFTLPTDLYLIKDHGVDFNGAVIDETVSSAITFLNSSLAAPSEVFPVYERSAATITVHPTTIIDTVTCRYLRIPTNPKWTYTIVAGTELFNNAAVDFQDFDLHESEFSNITIRMLSYFGVNIREPEVTKYAETLKQKEVLREEQ